MTPALIVHIGAGSIGILSGAAALAVAKGERLHRALGNVFFVSMLTMSALATYLAIVIPQARANLPGGVFTFYLVATAWMTVRRKEGTIGGFEVGAFLVAMGAAAASVVFGFQAARSPTGLFNGSQPPQYFIFAAVAALAAALDLKVILRGGIFGAPRIARHLWRMCAALFIATGSFFLGQQKVMPAFIQGSPLLFVPAIAPLVLMIYWLFRVRLTNRLKKDTIASQDRQSCKPLPAANTA